MGINNMIKLKYRLEKWEKVVVFQILEQNELFKNKNTFNDLDYATNNDMVITSSDRRSTDLEDKIIFVRRVNTRCPLSIGTKYFNNNEERNKYFDSMQKALKDWAANWEGWKEKVDKEATAIINIYFNKEEDIL